MGKHRQSPALHSFPCLQNYLKDLSTVKLLKKARVNNETSAKYVDRKSIQSLFKIWPITSLLHTPCFGSKVMLALHMTGRNSSVVSVLWVCQRSSIICALSAWTHSRNTGSSLMAQWLRICQRCWGSRVPLVGRVPHATEQLSLCTPPLSFSTRACTFGPTGGQRPAAKRDACCLTGESSES